MNVYVYIYDAQEWRFNLSRKVAGYPKMARSKDDVKYGTAQAKLSEDEALRIRYKHGTPLEGGKIADSEPVNLFSAAQHQLADQERHGDQDKQGGDHEGQEPTSPKAANTGNTTSTT